MPCPSQSSRFNHSDYIRWTVQTMKFLIVEPSLLPSPIPLGSKYSPQEEFFSSGEIFYGMCGIDISVFHCHLSMFSPMLSSEEAPALCWLHFRGGPPNCVLQVKEWQTRAKFDLDLACDWLIRILPRKDGNRDSSSGPGKNFSLQILDPKVGVLL